MYGWREGSGLLFGLGLIGVCFALVELMSEAGFGGEAESLVVVAVAEVVGDADVDWVYW